MASSYSVSLFVGSSSLAFFDTENMQHVLKDFFKDKLKNLMNTKAHLFHCRRMLHASDMELCGNSNMVCRIPRNFFYNFII